jgi:cellulose biosynthesis protein BcsQ
MLISFYAYEGNVGCTAAATNVGILLCRDFAKRTLIVNWNFELGMKTHLSEICQTPDSSLFRIISDYKAMLEGDTPLTQAMLNQITGQVNSTSIEKLSYLPALTEDEGKRIRHALFDWTDFYENYSGGLLTECLKSHWEKDYDVVLIISEHGLSPGAAICTMQLPDSIVILMEMGQIESSAHIIERITRLEKRKSRRALVILPVLSKVDNSEMALRERVFQEMEERFSRFLPPQMDPARYFKTARIPSMPYYAYSHEIAVMKDEHGSLARSYMDVTENLVRFIDT